MIDVVPMARVGGPSLPGRVAGALRDVYVVTRRNLVHIAREPLQLSDVTVIQPAHVERVLNLLRINFSHLVIDLSKGLTPVDLMALDMCDHALLVSQLELSSLRNVVRMLMTLTCQEGMHNKVRVVINRVGSDYSESAISLKKAEETIGKPIFWQVPNDSKAVLGGRVAGEPLILHAPKSRAQQSLQGLAEALGRRPERGAPVASSGGFLKGIFGGKK